MVLNVLHCQANWGWNWVYKSRFFCLIHAHKLTPWPTFYRAPDLICWRSATNLGPQDGLAA